MSRDGVRMPRSSLDHRDWSSSYYTAKRDGFMPVSARKYCKRLPILIQSPVLPGGGLISVM